MRAIDFVVRDSAGRVVRGILQPDAGTQVIDASANSQVSLNILQQEITDYGRVGNNLQITLSDGRKILVEDFFIEGQVTGSRLYVSSGGEIVEISFSESWGRTNYAHMNSSANADSSLVFDSPLTTYNADAALATSYSGDAAIAGNYSTGYIGAETTMGVAPLFLGGFAPGAAAAVGAGVLGVGALAAGGGDDGPRPVVANDPVAAPDGGLTFTGTGEPGATVEVDIGGVTQTAVVDDDGNWAITIDGEDLPTDGAHDVVITTTNPDGSTSQDTLPAVTVDTQPPEVELNTDLTGTFNATQIDGGLTLEGTGEPGATVTVEIGGIIETVVIGNDGLWSIDFDSSLLDGGEYVATATVTATDSSLNATVLTHSLTIDTVAPSSDLNGAIEGDNVLNISEAADGFNVSGTTQPGSTVTVTIGSQTVTVVADADGAWVGSFSASDLSPGEYDVDVNVTAVDAAGNSTSSTTVLTVDTVINSTFDVTGVEASGVINTNAAADGVSMSGTADAGSTVEVTVLGTTQTVTVSPDGTWTVTFASTVFAAMEGTADVVINVTDLGGNTTTNGGTLTIDTLSSLTLAGTQAGDNIINFVEANAGVPITGVADAGASISLVFNGTTFTGTADANGAWTITLPTSAIPMGTSSESGTITATDVAGNVNTGTLSINVDTENTIDLTTPIAGDDIVSGSELNAGFSITGSADAGSSVVVTMGTFSQTVTAGSSGSWSVSLPPNAVAGGTTSQTITAEATDPAGNVVNVSHSIQIDTEVQNLAITGLPVANGSILNAITSLSGITMSGTVEPGATVSVEFEGTTKPATVDANGNWSVMYLGAEIPVGAYTADVNVSATDANGNSSTTTASFGVDTEIPGSLMIVGTTILDIAGNEVVSNVYSLISDADSYSITSLSAHGSTSQIPFTASDDVAFGTTEFDLSAPVPVGSSLVVTAIDENDNQSSTMVVTSEAGSPASIDLSDPMFLGFELEAIDLARNAENAELTLTEADVASLSQISDTLTIYGGNDDSVTLDGASATSAQETINNATYDIYTLGTDGVSVVINSEIDVTLI